MKRIRALADFFTGSIAILMLRCGVAPEVPRRTRDHQPGWLVLALVFAAALSASTQAQDCRDHPARFQQECVDLDLTPLIEALRQRPAYGAVACGIVTVGYRFVGEAGQTFRYAGDTYEIERDGETELIAARHRRTYAVEGRILPLDVWPRDEFGFREARLPKRTVTP